MSEFGDIPQPEEVPSHDHDPLPTTPEIARIGVEEFESTARELNDFHALDRFLDIPYIRECFTGVRPEIRDMLDIDVYKQDYAKKWQAAYMNDFDKIKAAIMSVSENYVFIPNQYEDKGEILKYISMINVRAAQQVAAQNSDYFPPEAVTNTGAWLTAHPDEWRRHGLQLAEIRYGLLSGFPRASVEAYANKFHDNEKVRRQAQIQYREALLSTRTEESLNFISYNLSRDKQYVDQCQKIFQESGIDDVCEKLKRELLYPE